MGEIQVGREVGRAGAWPPGEWQRLVVDFNGTDSVYPSDRTVVDLFEERADQEPNLEAVRHGDVALSYRQLDARANQVARHLRGLGVGGNDIVVLLLEHSVDVVSAVLGVLKAGAAYAPVDPDTPPERLGAILTDIRNGRSGSAPVVLTHSSLQDRAARNGRVIAMDREASTLDALSSDRVGRQVSGDALAYVIYTSGSTGTPKGVMIGHRSLINYIWWAARQYCQGERTTWPLFSSLAFDLTVTSLFAPLISGGRIVVYYEAPGRRSLVILRVVEDGISDVVKLTPSHLAMIADRELSSTSIRRFVVGGEDLKTELARRVTERFARPVEIYNEYGPTEATVGCMIHRYDPATDKAPSVPIGRPAANTQIYVLDEVLEPAAPGVVGEMYVGGAGLAVGYFNRPDLTGRSFVQVEDFSQPGQSPAEPRRPRRLYRTGDLARWSVDGRLEFLGRADDQVKIGGFRIELGDIEAHLVGHSAIRECAVTAVSTDGDESTEALVAYYVSDAALPVAELKAFLARTLPHYMVPGLFVHLTQLPVTTNGKVDRKALARPTIEATADAAPAAEPVTETERRLASIWSELLKVSTVGRNDEFFALGGHSLLAMRVASRIRDAFGIDVPLEALFVSPTIATLAGVVDTQVKKSGSRTGSETPIVRQTRRTAGEQAKS